MLALFLLCRRVSGRAYVGAGSACTLRDIDVTTRKAIECCEAGVHVDSMLRVDVSCPSQHLADMRTESNTWPRALSSVSTRSFSAMSSCSESCSFGMPFEQPDDVGPDDTVGACMSSIATPTGLLCEDSSAHVQIELGCGGGSSCEMRL